MTLQTILDTGTHKIEIPAGATIAAAPIRKIPVEDFIERFPEAPFETLANSTNSKAIAFMSRLDKVNIVDLDSPVLNSLLTQMVTAALLTQGQKDTLLA
ncbi:hypothetical protein KAR91_46365 [Candidatus Pacearchaeota archaeon]|nr:hypothetical protein [Candidatus Pacearchaeota archaeon]